MKDSIWNAVGKSDNYDAEQAQRVAWFNKIKPVSHWKDPIDCWIAEADYENCAEAAIFFTGSELEIVERKDGEIRVQAVGYYIAIGA